MKSVFDTQQQQVDLSSKIVVGLERIAEAFRVLLWQHAKVVGLSPIQIQILVFLQHHEAGLCHVSHLAKEFNMTKATISDAIKALHQKKLVDKQPSSRDSRSYTIVLTDQGRQQVQSTENFADPIRSILGQWDDASLEALFSKLSPLIYELHSKGILSVQRTCMACTFHEKKGAVHFCNLLQKPLSEGEIRVDCPEFQSRESND